MQCTLGFYVSLLRFSWVAIAPQKLGLAIHKYAGKIFPGTLVLYDTQHPELVLMMCAPLILLVHGMRNISQIADAVIQWVAINVVYLASGVNTMHVQPCQPGSPISLTVNADAPIPINDVACNGAS